MTKDPGTRSTNDGSGQNLIKAIIAVVVIVGCGVWLAILLKPAPIPVFQEPTDQSSQWMKGYGALNKEHGDKVDEFYKTVLSRISVAPTDDKQGIVVEGALPAQTDLAALKAELSKIQPAVNIEWKVTTGR